MERDVFNAGKGVRENVAWEVRDEILVPRDMLSVDSAKINAYMNDNKEKIKKAISENEEVLPGVRFYIDTKFIAR